MNQLEMDAGRGVPSAGGAFSAALRGLAAGLVVCAGCTQSSGPANPPVSAPPPAVAAPEPVAEPQPEAPAFPSIGSEGRAVVETLDRAKMSQINNGFQVDADRDGIKDLIIMVGDAVYFAKGDGKGHFGERMQIAKMEEVPVAYRVDVLPAIGINEPALIFFNQNDQGFVQEFRGVNEQGLPILLDPEILEFTPTDF